MSAEENKAVLRRWIEAYNERDLQAEADVLAPDQVAHVAAVSGPLEGLGAWRQFSGSFAEAFPDIRLTIEDNMAEGDMVAARVAFRGTHCGEFQGIPPTGKEVAFTSIELNRVEEGKVQEHQVELDLLGLMQQLGAIPEPGHSSEEAAPTQSAAALQLLYSPNVLEGVFSEIRIHGVLGSSTWSGYSTEDGHECWGLRD